MNSTFSTQISWRLPSFYQKPEIASLLSYDWQIYLNCQECGWEERIEQEFACNINIKADKYRCGKCGKRGFRLVRHLLRGEYGCEECSRMFVIETAGYERVECPYCHSLDLFILSQRIEPPFSALFGQMLMTKEVPWGKSAEDDSEFLIESIRVSQSFPEFPLFLLVGARFAERLRVYGAYDKKGHACMLNLEGNFFRDYFRRTGEIAAGLRALSTFEETVRKTDEPIQRASVEHNVAMAVYSMLARYSEELVTAFASRPHIKADGLKAAERALAVFEQKPDVPDFRLQAARIHHMIGDLLKVGSVDDAVLELAVRHFDQALSSGALPSDMQLWVRASRGTAVSLMASASKALMIKAVKDLEAACSLDESRRAWSERWSSLANLATIYLDLERTSEAMAKLEQAAALAINEMNAAIGDEAIQAQKGEQFVGLFDRLAYAYSKLKRPRKALAALETGRAITLRLHTMDETELAIRKRKAVEQVGHDVFAGIFGGKASHAQTPKLRLVPVAKAIQELANHTFSCPTAFLVLSVWAGHITAIIATHPKVFRSGVLSFQWKINTNEVSFLLKFSELHQSPMREARMRKLCSAAYTVLFRPLADFFRHNGIKRIGVCAPGMLSHWPFEAFSENDSSPHPIVDEFQIFYLPSLTLGADLLKTRERPRRGRLLVIVGSGDDLPHIQEEVEALRGLWRKKMVCIEGYETTKTKQRILHELQEDYDYIHFMCHGTFDPVVPLDSALQLVVHSEKQSEQITARDLLALRFQNAPVITLSACSSALTSYSSTNNCVGLTGAFLQAGARCVIGSRWPVYDDLAATFMAQLYGQIKTSSLPVQTIVNEVQRKLKASTGIWDWAAFSYLGIP